MHVVPGNSFYGVSGRRRHGLGACQLPFGTLLVSFAHAALPQTVVSAVEGACAKLRGA